MKTDEKILLSACLAGVPCRYDGKSKPVRDFEMLVKSGKAVLICPECDGGLPVPRKPSEIRIVKGKRKVYNVENRDVTAAYEKGAAIALEKALAQRIRTAVLKARSPSCGKGRIYDGTFTHTLTEGNGVTAQLLTDNGICVFTEDEWMSKQEERKMSDKTKLGVVFGGQSGEHEVSRVSAVNVLNAIDQDKYDITVIGITKQGKWKIYSGQWDKIADGSWEDDTANITEGFSVFDDPVIQDIDLFFPVLHGPMGEDGTIQGVFEMMNKPYVGCGVLASAVGMDKIMTKIICESVGIPVVPYFYFTQYDWANNREGIIKEVSAPDKGFPVFIKPANMGSSVGITKAHNLDEFVRGVETALTMDHRILVEGTINGREIECAVLEENGDVRATAPGEVVASKEFYDYEAKYSKDQDSKIIIPAAISDKLADQIKDYAVRAFRTLDCTGLSRVDFFISHATYNIYLNEINTLPGFTDISMFSKMWAHDGVDYKTLVEKLIQSAGRKRMTSYTD